jgi:hypothetical protein
VRELPGHSKLHTTQRYVHATGADLRDAKLFKLRGGILYLKHPQPFSCGTELENGHKK